MMNPKKKEVIKKDIATKTTKAKHEEKAQQSVKTKVKGILAKMDTKTKKKLL